MPRQLESALERKVCHAAAKRLGVFSIKLNGPGRRGWPDRLFLIPGGRPVFIEFKAKRGRLSELQKVMIEELNNFGYTTAVCVDFDQAMMILDMAHRAAMEREMGG